MGERRGVIAFVITGLGYGGAETQLVRLAAELLRRGWELRVVSLLPLDGHADALRAAGIPLATLAMRRGVPDPRAIVRLATVLRRWRPDIVHSFMVHANLLARAARLLHWFPVQISSQRTTHEGGGALRLAYRATDWLCTVTTQVSRAGAEGSIRARTVPGRKLIVIPNALDADAFRPRDAEPVDAPGDERPFRWLAVGRLAPPKDYPTMLEAFARVWRYERRARLAIAGAGPLQSELEERADYLGIAEQVEFLGLRTDIATLLASADAFVMSSAWEGMSNALLEACAAGLPVVTTAVGGATEIVVDGRTGSLVPPGSPETLAESMLAMMRRTPAERACMGSAARERVKRLYAMDRIASMWERLYLSCLTGAQPTAEGAPRLAGAGA